MYSATVTLTSITVPLSTREKRGRALYYIIGPCLYKAIPLQAWTGPKGSRRLRLPDFKTIGT